MKISVFGLGYVGSVTAACLARDGHTVVGVDLNPEKVALITAGESPIVEPGLSDLLLDGVRKGRIWATTEVEEAIRRSEVSLVCVGTPPGERGDLDLTNVFNVCTDIGRIVAQKGEPHIVVVRSTSPPGTLERCRTLLEEAAGNVPIHAAFYPEFLREGTAIRDYDWPPFTIIGSDDEVAERVLRELYGGIDAPVLTMKPSAAEMVKYVSNAWHATKVAFANEVGRIAKSYGEDGREVMEVIVQDTKLNISPTYLRPGFAYGGSCLPKDVGALLAFARHNNVPVPLLNALPVTNSIQIDLAVERVLSLGVRSIAVFGLAFKPGTDDLRESPAVPLVKRLIGEGRQVRVYDPEVYRARLMGTNLAFIRSNIPHFEELLVEEAAMALEGVEAVVITHGAKVFRDALAVMDREIQVIDLAGILTTDLAKEYSYHGLGW